MPYPIYIYILVVLSLLVGCDKTYDEESLPQEVPVPIELAVSDSYLSTRAPISTIDATNYTSVGIYAAQEGSTSGQFPWTTSPFLSNTVPSGINQGQLSFSPKLYYPTGGKQVKFYAYYPRTTNTATTSNSYITPAGNGTAPIYNFTLADQQDVMHAVSTPSSSTNSSSVALQYNHKLSQIVITTTVLSGLLRTGQILNVPSKGALNLETGVITWGSTLTNIPVTIPIAGGTSDPVLVPANATSYQLRITLLVLPTTYNLIPSNGVFSPGQIYSITIN